jgi:hypothetical protein
VAQLLDAARLIRPAGPGGHIGEWPNLPSDEVHDIALPLELAVDEQQRMP